MSTPDPRAMRPRNEAGFTFVELIVGLAIMVTIATAVTPVLLSSLDRARVDSAVGALQGFGDAIDAFEADVKEHPGYLHQLVVDIRADDPSDGNICGNTYKVGTGKGGTDTWLGPYLDRLIPANGRVPVGIGLAHDELERLGSRNRAGELRIQVDEVTVEDAEALDLHVDGQDGPNGGSIRWADLGTGYVTLYYHKPSPRC